MSDERCTGRTIQQDAINSILRAGGAIRRRLARLMSGHGLTPSQYHVLRGLRESPGGLPTMKISDRLPDEEPGVTRLVDRIERSGHLERIRSRCDRRRIDCRITPAGLELLRRLDGPVEELERSFLCSMTEAEMKHLHALLRSVERTG